MNTYHIRGLDPAPFAHLFGLDDAALRAAGAIRYRVDAKPGFPDRIEMRDLEIGETALLLNYEHHADPTPFRASHAIFVREGATRAYEATGEIPDPLMQRVLSLRAFDDAGMMIDADLAEGAAIEPAIERMFADPATAYIHAHYAKRGCFAARIDRA